MNILRTSLLAAALIFSAATAFADTYKVDPVHSSVIFKISHLNVSPFYGRFNNPTGTITIDAADDSKSAVEISVKADDVDTGNAKRDEHLRNPDFFNSKQFPVISFKSTSVKKVDDKTFEVAGDLTLHGVTKPITITLNKTGEAQTRAGYRTGYETSFTIKRSDYGIKFNPEALGDEVTITAGLAGVKQ